jgi:hypothetical protein
MTTTPLARAFGVSISSAEFIAWKFCEPFTLLLVNGHNEINDLQF